MDRIDMSVISGKKYKVLSGVDLGKCARKEFNLDLLDEQKNEVKVMKPFTKQYTRLQYSLVSDAKIISVELSNKLYELFAEFQDGFATRVDTKNPNYETIKNYITDTQVNMVKLIKEYNTGMMD